MDLDQAQSRKYIAILALVACLILGGGWLLRPREIAHSPAPLPSEGELAQLTRRADRRSIDNMATYFAVTAGDAESSVVYLPATGTSGIAWDDGTIVTAPLQQDADSTISIRWKFGEDRAQPTIWGPRMPLSALTTSGGLPGLSTARNATSPPAAGNWVLAVWRTGLERGFAPGNYLQSASVTCGRTPVQEVVSSIALNHLMAGGGLFDIDGALLAVILPCDQRLAAVATSSVARILQESDTNDQRVLARYGLVLGALTVDEKAHFTMDDGVIIREVWTGYRGDERGLMPGDIIGALDGIAVATPGDLVALTDPGGEEALELTVQRGPKTLTIALAANVAATAPVTEPTPGSGLVWDALPERYTIDSVVPGSPAAMAGIQPGDRLIRIDHTEPRSLTQVQRLFANASALPVLLEIDRGDHRLAVLLR